MKRPTSTPDTTDRRVRGLLEAFLEDLAILYPEILWPEDEGGSLTFATYGTLLVRFRHEDVHIAADQVRAEANAERGRDRF